MSKHTPTPWVITCGTQIVAEDHSAFIADTHDNELSAETNMADAAHVVKCVNAHDDLVAALETIIQRLPHEWHEKTSNQTERRNRKFALDKARAILAKVES